jgi:serine/threonine protein kinase
VDEAATSTSSSIQSVDPQAIVQGWTQGRALTQASHGGTNLQSAETMSAEERSSNSVHLSECWQLWLLLLRELMAASCLHGHEMHKTTAKKLSAGQVSSVYRGKWDKNRVAIKYYRPSQDHGERGRLLHTFANDVTYMMSLRHPSILPILGWGFDPLHQRMFLVKEFVERGNLLALLGQPIIITGTTKKALLLDVARGLEFLHTRSPCLVHCDVKSLNVLVSYRWRAKLQDFGMVCVSSGKAQAQIPEIQGHTYAGSYAWMSPECFAHPHQPIPGWDIWGFGVIAWELATRCRPWDGRIQMQVVASLLAGKRLACKDSWDHRFTRVLEGCWHARPDRRPRMSRVVSMLESGKLRVPDEEIDGPLPADHPMYVDVIADRPGVGKSF